MFHLAESGIWLNEGYLRFYLFCNDIILIFLGSGLSVIVKTIRPIYTQFIKQRVLSKKTAQKQNAPLNFYDT